MLNRSRGHAVMVEARLRQLLFRVLSQVKRLRRADGPSRAPPARDARLTCINGRHRLSR
jgi:hypothetical protein